MYFVKRKSNLLKLNDVIIIIGLCMMPFLFSFFGATTITKAVLVLVFIGIILSSGLENSILSYLFLTFFIPITRGQGFTAVALCGLVLLFVLCVKLFQTPVKISTVIILVLLAIYTFRAYEHTGDFSAITIMYDGLVALNVRNIIQEEDKSNKDTFLFKLFFTLFLAAVISILWGILNYGLLSGERFVIPIGTDRACMLCCSGIVFPLFYIKNKLLKAFCIFIMVFCLLLTVSMTGIICLFMFSGIYVVYKYKSNGQLSVKKLAIVILILICICVFIIVWNNGTGIESIDKVIRRAQLVSDQFSSGDYDAATTGRYYIIQRYLEYFSDFPFIKKLFGGGRPDYFGIAYYRNYSHNSIVDAVMFIGIIPFVSLLIWNFIGIREIKCKRNKIQIILLKCIMLVTCLSVSMFTGSCFFPFILL